MNRDAERVIIAIKKVSPIFPHPLEPNDTAFKKLADVVEKLVEVAELANAALRRDMTPEMLRLGIAIADLKNLG